MIALPPRVPPLSFSSTDESEGERTLAGAAGAVGVAGVAGAAAAEPYAYPYIYYITLYFTHFTCSLDPWHLKL